MIKGNADLEVNNVQLRAQLEDLCDTLHVYCVGVRLSPDWTVLVRVLDRDKQQSWMIRTACFAFRLDHWARRHWLWNVISFAILLCFSVGGRLQTAQKPSAHTWRAAASLKDEHHCQIPFTVIIDMNAITFNPYIIHRTPRSSRKICKAGSEL